MKPSEELLGDCKEYELKLKIQNILKFKRALARTKNAEVIELVVVQDNQKIQLGV